MKPSLQQSQLQQQGRQQQQRRQQQQVSCNGKVHLLGGWMGLITKPFLQIYIGGQRDSPENV